MKKSLLILAVLPFLCTGCFLARIVTVSPDHENVATYSTTVTVPKAHTVTTTTCVVEANEDISLYLDLKAVAAAFAQASTVEEFEWLLNNPSYMLSNLDLNRDGYIDYLRVLETIDHRAHVFVIQACLARDVYQDVATVIAEVASSSPYVQVVGCNYIYGPNYIVRPVYVVTPAIYVHLRKPSYNPWRSPWYWDHFPSYYKRPAPILVNHYQAYVETYMTNHRYCREVRFDQTYHYPEYLTISRSIQRNDYEVKYPERSFTVRNANTPVRSAGSATTQAQPVRTVTNARDISDNRAATTTRTTATTTTRSAATSASTRAAGSATTSGSSTTRTAGSTTTTSSSSTTRTSSGSTTTSAGSSTTRTATTPTASGSTSGSSTTSSSSSVTRSGSTTSATTSGSSASSSASGSSASSSTSRTSSSASSSSSTTRTSSSTSGSTASSSTTSSSSSTTRSSSSVSRSAAPGSTTVNSRVSSSGSSNTRISTVSASGTQSTVRRGSTTATAPVTRSSASGSTTRSTSSSTATRSASTSGSSSTSGTTRSASSTSSTVRR